MSKKITITARGVKTVITMSDAATKKLQSDAICNRHIRFEDSDTLYIFNAGNWDVITISEEEESE